MICGGWATVNKARFMFLGKTRTICEYTEDFEQFIQQCSGDWAVSLQIVQSKTALYKQ